MGGRGRGRGQSVSFNIEQLGFGRGEAVPVSVTQPPPLFPPLENKALPLIKDVEYEYILVTQKDLNTRMTSSPFFLKSSFSQKGITQYADNKLCSTTAKDLPVLWDRMPLELKKAPPIKRSLSAKANVKIKRGKQLEDPDKILAKLEEKEQEGEADGEKDGNEAGEDDENKDEDDDKIEVEDEIEEDLDEEMDEGTDYAREYFDNGEAYLDEDENLDDGEALY